MAHHRLPCAFGLATPMSIMVAAGKGVPTGVLFWNAERIEVLRNVITLVVDKTGTLSLEKPVLASVVAAAGIEENELLRLAASDDLSRAWSVVYALCAGRREPTAGSDQGHALCKEAEGDTAFITSDLVEALGTASMLRGHSGRCCEGPSGGRTRPWGR